MARMVFFWSVISGGLPGARMWGGGRSAASVNAAECAGEILDQSIERQLQGLAAANQHIVVSRPERSFFRHPNHRAQPPAHAVALGGIADLLGDGETHPHRSILAPIERLQYESAYGSPGAGRGGQEVCALPEPLHR